MDDTKAELQEIAYGLQQVAAQIYGHLHDPHNNAATAWKKGKNKGRFEIKNLNGDGQLFRIPTGNQILQLLNAYQEKN